MRPALQDRDNYDIRYTFSLLFTIVSYVAYRVIFLSHQLFWDVPVCVHCFKGGNVKVKILKYINTNVFQRFRNCSLN